jgi:exosortase
VSTLRSPFTPRFWSAVGCGLAGAALFHFFGNAARGYIDTASLFHWWGYQWLNPASETEHGWVILAVSVWLLWRQRQKIADCELRNAEWSEPADPSDPASPSSLARSDAVRPIPAAGNPQSAIRNPQWDALVFPFAALVAMTAGLALHAAGFAAQQARISIVALLVFTWGVIRLGGGRRWGAAAVFPLAFMVFAIPLSMLDEVGLPLRVWVTDAGEAIARAAGIPVLRSGTQLVAPDGRFNYDVAAPCSGVRSLMALTALALLVGYLNFRSSWRRAVILGLALPLVYLGNVVRIVAIVFAAHGFGTAWGTRVHEVMGYGVFVIVLGGVMGAVALLQRMWPEPGERAEGGKGSAVVAPADTAPLPGRWHAAAVLLIVLGLVGAEMGFLHRLAQLPPRGQVGVTLAPDGVNPVDLPAFIGTEWIGQRVDVTAVEREILPPDTGYSRRHYAFLADRSRDVFLSIVLSGRDRTSIHRPELCLVGQGWTIEGATRHAFRHPGTSADAGTFAATVLRVKRERATARGKVVVPQLVAYWFVGGDEVVPSHWGRFQIDTWNRVVRARVDRWAYVLMQTDVVDGEAAALARMQTVLDGTLPTFQRVASESDGRRTE